MNLTLETDAIGSNNVLSAGNQQERSQSVDRLHPWYVTGFVEGEGTFHIASYRDPRMAVGVKLIPEFHVSQSYMRKETLELMQQFFCCGYLKRNHARSAYDTTWVYVVRDRNDLVERIIPFFEQYPMRSRKQESFLLFAKVVRAMVRGEHRTSEGVQALLALAYQMNGNGMYRRGGSKELLQAIAKSSETIRQTP